MLSKSNMHGYQLTGVDHIVENPMSGLFLDMGLGKTITTLTAINYLLYEELEISNVLIIAPKRVVESVWTAEALNWEHTKHLKITRIIGTDKQRRAALNTNSDVYLIGRDNVAWLCAVYGGTRLPFDMLVIDESSSFKNYKSIRFKSLRAVQPSFKRIVILTGTPAPNGLIDLWSQIYLLDRGERLGKLIGQYRERFFKPGKRNGHIVYNYEILDDSEEQIHDLISDICISMKAKDWLTLPERINNYINIELPANIRKKYDEFEEEQVLELIKRDQVTGEEGYEFISAVNAAALSNKLLQFANGAVYDENREWHEIHKLKLEETEEIIEQAGGKPVLIAWTYRHDQERLMKHLAKYKPRQLKNDKDIEDWNAGKIRVMMMHPASGGHGLNLQSGGNIIVWFGQTWSLELYQQFNARLDRQGQTESVIVHHLVCKGTIDIDVVNSIGKKTTTQDDLMSAIKARIKKYMK